MMNWQTVAPGVVTLENHEVRRVALLCHKLFRPLRLDLYVLVRDGFIGFTQAVAEQNSVGYVLGLIGDERVFVLH